MLAIAIINYNTFEKTVECVNSIFKTAKCEYKIYLLDNASKNDSFERLSELFGHDGRIELIKSEENLGYGKGNNLCIEKAKSDGCDYILISNNDIIFKEGCIDLLLDEIKKSGAFITSPKVLGLDGKQQVSIKAVKPSFKEYLLFSNYILGHFVSKKKTREYFKKTAKNVKGEVYWASGACFMADMNQFEKIGFFDPYTFLYFEEYIISEKADLAGLKRIYVPDAEVIHYHAASVDSSSKLFTRLENFKSECYMFSNYWVIPKKKLKTIRCIRCLEVLYTFTKNKRLNEAFAFIKESRRILKSTPRKE